MYSIYEMEAMRVSAQYETMLRDRITELRIRKNVSEHAMSLELGKSGSYIRGISSGLALPSLKELFNVIEYFGMTPAEFFAEMEAEPSPTIALQKRIAELSTEDIEKISLFVSWIDPSVQR